MDKTFNELAGHSLQRIEAITDGVFAIAMTLLVLDIRVPAVTMIKTEAELFSTLVNLAPKLITYLMSFMTLGIFWTAHSTQFSYIENSDRRLSWIVIFFLMFVALLPFTTAFLNEYITFKISIAVYWLNIFALGVLLFVQWNYAYRHNYLRGSEDEIKAVYKALQRRGYTAQLLYAIGASLCFFSTYLSILVIVGVQFHYATALFILKTRKK